MANVGVWIMSSIVIGWIVSEAQCHEGKTNKLINVVMAGMNFLNTTIFRSVVIEVSSMGHDLRAYTARPCVD